MPAKKEYLSGPWKRFSKLMAALIGAYITTMLFHVALAKVSMPNETPVVLSGSYTGFVVWVGLMVMVYFIKKAWHAWLLFFMISFFSGLIIFI
ncbi:hypothetical protein ACSTS3_06155 [Aquimarina muelleri]|uniref:hypothetical protein n=1 Tax=Aquimarina muelleri TaxID=279356 RepID=UPI003F685C20